MFELTKSKYFLVITGGVSDGTVYPTALLAQEAAEKLAKLNPGTDILVCCTHSSYQSTEMALCHYK